MIMDFNGLDFPKLINYNDKIIDFVVVICNNNG